MDLTFENKLDAPVIIGIVTARNISINEPLPEMERRLEEVLEQRKNELSETEDAFRRASRDMLRNGSYKPTGRGKPASEYLLKTARKGSFPRINTVVDINNYISLKYLTPISLWDLDSAETEFYQFKLGDDEDEFVFNKGGQAIDLKDLVTGYAKHGDNWQPFINPIKDSLQTKTTDETRNIGVAVYYPKVESRSRLIELLDEFKELLEPISEKVTFQIVN